MFLILVKFSLSYSIFMFEKTDSPGYHTQGFKIYFGPRTFLKNEKCSFLIAEKESIFIFVTLSL